MIEPGSSLPSLPIREVLPQLGQALDRHPNALIIAPPGAGKTTLVPRHLLYASWRGNGTILVLEPRRLAARAAASRIASLLSEPVGRTAGYRTRIDAAVSPETRIEVVTEGLLIRRLQSDPGLDGVAAVILDEVHERSVESDLALALCLDLQRVLRPELRLIAMSATADAARLAPLMQAEVVESAGRLFPVTINHARRDITSSRDLPDAMTRAVRTALEQHEGDILAFLPGMAEIRRVQVALAESSILALPLHGDLPIAEQDRALSPADSRRVVLATAIAETSLTVPGVRIVIDGGWRRAPRLDSATGLTRLATVRISRAAADQRAGRAGREGEGIAIRLWSQALHRGLAAFDRPEILEAELSSLMLDCAAWGTPIADLRFPDSPPAGAIAAASELLGMLGAFDRAHRITDLGRRMVQLGAHPRLAAIMLAADTPQEAACAADLAALLEERDPLRAPDALADVGLRLEAIAAEAPDADRAALSRIRRAAAQYRRRLRLSGSVAADGDPGRLLAAGFPDRVAQRRGEPGSFRLSGGGGARLPVTDPLAKAPLLAIAALEQKASARIRLAAPLDPARLPAGIEAGVTELVETGFDPVSGTAFSRRRRRFGTLVLSDRTEPAGPMEIATALANAVTSDNLRDLPWTSQARQLQARVILMRGIEPTGWPDLSDEALVASVQEWLAPHLAGMTRKSDLQRLDLAAVLLGLLPWDLTPRLDKYLPLYLALPGGRAAVDYTEPVPLASARAQAFYGLTETPSIACGHVNLRLALLSPAGRPVAITGDIASFWRNVWPDVRRDMRGRYPRHFWPEFPATEKPVHTRRG